jgi:hypothetical protein
MASKVDRDERHTSGAKAPLILHRFTGDKSPVYRPNDFLSKL